MEFSNARRERFFSQEEDDQEESYKQLHPFAPSSSSSTSSAAARWAESSSGPADASDPSPGLPVVEREHMFDKVVTPSDVGKLNRLVIPKQHAEKYFPLDAASNEKGLLLSFEDRTGKPWRFRYSYWNSSQSYVMTKGWSRFVKEKRLDAGDTVSFGRGVGETGRDRLFIDWKRRPEAREPPGIPRLPLPITGHQSVAPFGRSLGPWSCDRLYLPPPATTLYDHHHHHQHRQGYAYNAASPSTSGAGQYLFFRSAAGFPQTPVQLGPGGDRTVGPHMVLDSVPVAHGKAAPKRVRLFGVNLDCPESDGGGDGGNSSQAVVSLVPNTAPPLLHLRLGGVDSSMSSPREEQPPSSSSLDLDM